MIFDWRGTLVRTLPEEEWARQGLLLARRDASPAAVAALTAVLRGPDGSGGHLDTPGTDCDREVHRRVHEEVFAQAGLDPDLAAALYAVQSDPAHDPFASDVARTLRTLRGHGVRIAVLSDIHFDIRPAFAAAGLDGLVDAFVLSFEQGAQKPDPAVFAAALRALGAAAGDTLMVGDRSGPDGAAVECGVTTLLLPPLRDVHDRRLDRVLALCGCR